MTGLMRQNVPVTLLGLAKPHVVFVEDAEIDPGCERDWRPIGAALVVFERELIVAVQIVDIRQLEERTVVVFFEAERFFKLG